MNNGKSRLIPQLSANLTAMILFLCCTVFCLIGFTVSFWNGRIWWLLLITFFLSAIIFFIEGNAFIKKCSVQRALFYAASLLSMLIFRLLLGIIPSVGIVFKVIDYVIRGLAALFALISTIRAYRGFCFNAPLIGKLTKLISKKSGVF